MEVAKRSPAIKVDFIGGVGSIEITVYWDDYHVNSVSIPLALAPDVAAAMQTLFNEINGE